MESPRPLEVKEDLEFLLQLYKSIGLIATCLRPIMVQELKEGEKQYKRWKKRRWRRRRRGVLRRRQQWRRLRSAGIGKKWRRVFRRAEMSVQFYLPFFIQSFLSLIRRTAGYILSRRKPCCLMTKNEREIDVVFTTTIQPASPLHNTHWSGIENSNLSNLKEKLSFFLVQNCSVGAVI